MLKWITPSLAVAGDDWVEEDTFSDAGEAVTWIRNGGTAFVTDDAVAAAVLVALGLSPQEIEDRFHFAATGQVLDG